jgi:hypothetical protein
VPESSYALMTGSATGAPEHSLSAPAFDSAAPAASGAGQPLSPERQQRLFVLKQRQALRRGAATTHFPPPAPPTSQPLSPRSSDFPAAVSVQGSEMSYTLSESSISESHESLSGPFPHVPDGRRAATAAPPPSPSRRAPLQAARPPRGRALAAAAAAAPAQAAEPVAPEDTEGAKAELDDTLAVLATANAATRLKFDWEAHRDAVEKLRALNRAHPHAVQARRKEVLLALLPGVAGLRSCTARAALHALGVRSDVWSDQL